MEHNLNYIALICARGGSKGLPGKNIKLFNGIPLIAWSIKMALSEDKISRVIVSTDSEDIALIAKKYGAEVPFLRPKNLAQDDSSEWLVWRHAINYLNTNKNEYDGLIVLPVTAPLRAQEDIQNCLTEYEKGESDIVITITESHRNPFFNMVTLSKNNNASIVIQSKNKIFRRQDAPDVFDITTVAYVLRPNFIEVNNGIFDGKVRTVRVPIERSIDIDTEFDFEIAEYLFTKNEKL
jgi:CMP-N-acetylneuraminic acid synthetase